MAENTDTVRRINQVSSWRMTSHRGTVATPFDVQVVYMGGVETAWCSVDIRLPNGEMRKFRGEGEITRGGKVRPSQPSYVQLPIRKVEMRSLLGDVTVSGRTIREAGEAYASEALKIVVDEWYKSGAAAEWQAERERRLALVESAKEMQAGQLVSVELTVDELNVILVGLSNYPGAKSDAVATAVRKLSDAVRPVQGHRTIVA